MTSGAGKCPEWQRELTVNQPPHGFEGSSPSFPTTLRPDGLRVAQPCKSVRAKRVRRSLSAAKAKTDLCRCALSGLRAAQPRKSVRAKRVRRSLSAAKAKTDLCRCAL